MEFFKKIIDLIVELKGVANKESVFLLFGPPEEGEEPITTLTVDELDMLLAKALLDNKYNTWGGKETLAYIRILTTCIYQSIRMRVPDKIDKNNIRITFRIQGNDVVAVVSSAQDRKQGAETDNICMN